MDDNKPDVPEELQHELVIAIQKLCVFIHDAAGMSQVVLHISHVSDALSRSGVTAVSAVVGGQGVTRGDGPAPAVDKEQAQTVVNDLINGMMAKAKAKGEADKPKE